MKYTKHKKQKEHRNARFVGMRVMMCWGCWVWWGYWGDHVWVVEGVGVHMKYEGFEEGEGRNDWWKGKYVRCDDEMEETLNKEGKTKPHHVLKGRKYGGGTMFWMIDLVL